MPILEEHRHLYPADWKQITADKIAAAGNRCQCTGECGRSLDHLHPTDGRCRNVQGQPKWGHHKAQSVVILAVAHLDHDPSNNADDNHRVFCPGCHVVHDQAHHWHTRRERFYEQGGFQPLFDLDTLAPTDDGEPACV